jgi:hypothetical protein
MAGDEKRRGVSGPALAVSSGVPREIEDPVGPSLFEQIIMTLPLETSQPQRQLSALEAQLSLESLNALRAMAAGRQPESELAFRDLERHGLVERNRCERWVYEPCAVRHVVEDHGFSLTRLGEEMIEFLGLVQAVTITL